MCAILVCWEIVVKFPKHFSLLCQKTRIKDNEFWVSLVFINTVGVINSRVTQCVIDLTNLNLLHAYIIESSKIRCSQ